ncbi:hypothetical protein GCK32_001854 [Trichostrongylus colubriformis]|uniref:DOMON domain-containing protein n=1 Tax=Trichostrongylus colubriformis TaxID=6319 RepID=A0AAN8IRP0_TRICO
MSITTLTILTLLCCSNAVLSACVYTHPYGYSLRWLVLGDNVIFKLEHSNISMNEYTGIGFGKNLITNMDRIIVQLNSSDVSVFELPSYGKEVQPGMCDGTSLITLSKRHRNRNIRADFSRPIVTNSSDLNACQTWNFITTPTKIVNGSYYADSTNSDSVQICNIAQDCDVIKMMNATISTRSVPGPSDLRPFEKPKMVAALPRESSNLAPSLNWADPMLWLPNVERLQRRKRQTGYRPTNNIYGYDYSSSPSSQSDTARLVAETQYSQQQGGAGQSGGFQAYDAVPEQSAILSNDQQNALNYQQIRQSNPGSFNAAAYSANYYGGALADAPQRGQIQGGYQQSTSSNFVSPIYAPATSLAASPSSPAPYQSVVDLKTTRLRDPTTLAYYSDVPSTGNAQAMYYPYRTSTNYQTYNGNTISSANSGIFRDNAVSSASNGVYRDATANPCSLPDPYWCDYYVRIYMNSSITLSGLDRQTVCMAMAIAYSRNEGEIKPALSSPKEDDRLDELARLKYGYSVSELQAMYSQGNSTDTWIENNPKLGYEHTSQILIALGMGQISRAKAKDMLIEEWWKLSKEHQDQMKNRMRFFVVLDAMAREQWRAK